MNRRTNPAQLQLAAHHDQWSSIEAMLRDRKGKPTTTSSHIQCPTFRAYLNRELHNLAKSVHDTGPCTAERKELQRNGFIIPPAIEPDLRTLACRNGVTVSTLVSRVILNPLLVEIYMRPTG